MPRGTATQINASSLVCLLFLSWSSITTASVLTEPPKNNPLNIDWYPAPSPEKGPPLSAGALRDKSLLPAEIGGILGAYVFAVLTVGIVLVLLGRRLRMSVQRAAKALDIEMVDPKIPKNIEVGLKSPGPNPTSPRNFSRPSPEKDQNPYIFPSNGLSPITPPGTDPYVDARIVEADQEMMQRDLEDLYAHVMEQEEAKRAGTSVKEMPPPTLSPRSIAPVPAEAPQRQGSPSKKAEKNRPATLTLEEPRQKSHSRTSSIISSLKSPKRKGIRGMRISSPIPTPIDGAFNGNASDEEPLTPRYYAPPPPPPVPKDQVPFTHSRQSSSGDSPTRSIASQLSPALSPALSPYGNASRHRTTLSKGSVASSNKGDPNSATSQTPLFNNTNNGMQSPHSQFGSQNPYAQHQAPAQSSTRVLPLRSFEPAVTSPSFKPQTTKTTVLERTTRGNNGPTTGGLRTPWSAGAVPYSPYQPYTPMMPITPRLVTKQERKAKKKIEGRAPVLEMIKAEDEMWDSAY